MRRGTFAPFVLATAVAAAVAVTGCSSSEPGDPGPPQATAVVTGAATATPPATADATTSGAMPGPTGSSGPASTASTGGGSTPAGKPTVPADVPTTGPNLRQKGERPPVMPELATEHTKAGAVAFAKFFELTTDWAYATTSTAYMKHYYAKSCVTCSSVAMAIDRAANKNRYFVGDRFVITNVGRAVPDKSHGAQYHVDVSYRVSVGEVLERDGTFINGAPATAMTDRIWLGWNVSWMVNEYGPVP